MLKTDDDGITFTWESLSSIITDGSGNYYASAFYQITNQGGPGVVTATNTGNMLGEPDDVGALFTYTVGGYDVCRIEVDLGGLVNGPITLRVRSMSVAQAGSRRLFSSNEQVCVSADAIVWNCLQPGGNAWAANSDTFAWGGTVTINAGAKPFRYIRLEFEPPWEKGAPGVGQTGYIDAVEVMGVTSVDSVVRPVWCDVSTEAGQYLFLTAWRGASSGAGALVLEKRLTSDLSLVSSVSLGSCTLAQLNARTYWAAPFCENYDSDRVLVYGRMQNPQGLANPEHLIRTTNGGAAWSSVENSFGADRISAFRSEGTVNGSRIFYAVRSGAGVPAFYTGVESLALAGNLPFDAGVSVLQDALTVDAAAQVAVGADGPSAGGVMIAQASSPYAAVDWVDITGSNPAASIRSLTYV